MKSSGQLEWMMRKKQRKAIVLAHENPYITKDELLECLILIVNNQEDECS